MDREATSGSSLHETSDYVCDLCNTELAHICETSIHNHDRATAPHIRAHPPMFTRNDGEPLLLGYCRAKLTAAAHGVHRDPAPKEASPRDPGAPAPVTARRCVSN